MGQRQDMFLVPWSLSLFRNLFCKANSMFKQFCCLVYVQVLGLHLALAQFCRVGEKLPVLYCHSWVFLQRKANIKDRFLALHILLFSLLLRLLQHSTETSKSMWRWCACISINVQELCVYCSDWNIDIGNIIHDITQQCKFFKKNLSLVSLPGTRIFFQVYIPPRTLFYILWDAQSYCRYKTQFLVTRSLHHQNANFTPEYVGCLLNYLKKYMVKKLDLMYPDYPLQKFSSGF